MMVVAVAIAVESERIVAEMHALESRVIDFHSAGTEIRDVEEFLAVDLAGGCAFVDGAVRGAVVGIIHFEFAVFPLAHAEMVPSSVAKMK